jgi:Na+/melibiose symporter-like transporter
MTNEAMPLVFDLTHAAHLADPVETATSVLPRITSNDASKINHAEVQDATATTNSVTTITVSPIQASPTAPFPEPNSSTNGVPAATVGWIVAVIFACIMTVCSVWLMIRGFSARQRRAREAKRRRSEAYQMDPRSST